MAGSLPLEFGEIVDRALREDVRSGDVTSLAVVPEEARGKGNCCYEDQRSRFHAYTSMPGYSEEVARLLSISKKNGADSPRRSAGRERPAPRSLPD